MNLKQQTLDSFASAWEFVLDFSLPKFLSNNRESSSDISAYAISLFIPAVALIMGLILLIIFKLSSMIFSEIGSAIVFAIVATLFCEMKESGRGSSLLVAVINAMTTGNSSGIIYSLPRLRAPRVNDLVGALPTIILVLIELFKVVSFFVLALHGYALWVVAVVVLPFTLQGFLMSMIDLNSGRQFLEVEQKNQYHIWIVGVGIMLFMALCLPKIVLIAVLLSIITAIVLRRFFEKNYGGASAEMITLTGAICEIITIFCGVLFVS